jgi:hypothetical protein
MVAEAISETQELQTVSEAIAMIDRGLGTVQHRELISADEVADLLLDLRMLLTPLTLADLDVDEEEILAN